MKHSRQGHSTVRHFIDAFGNAWIDLVANMKKKISRKRAEAIVQELLECTEKLDQSVAILVDQAEEDFFISYRRQVGEVLGFFYLEILSEVFREYPDLEPESLKL